MKVALVGTGYIAERHLRACRASKVHVQGVLGSSVEKARVFAAENGIGVAYGDLSEVCGDGDITASIVGTPNVLHGPQCLELLRAGKHVLVDKPMAVNATVAQQLADAAQRAERTLLVGHMWRYDREVLHVRKRMEQGALGTVFKTKSYGVHTRWGPKGWFARRADAGGGALIDMGIHAIDTARFLLGDPRPEKVFAHIETRFGDYDVDDTGTIIVTWDSGSCSVVESGWWHPHADGEEASVQIFGTEGYARVFPTTVATVKEDALVEETTNLPPREEHCDQHMYDEQLQDFVAAARENRPPKVPLDAGVTAMRIIDACYASAARGESVSL